MGIDGKMNPDESKYMSKKLLAFKNSGKAAQPRNRDHIVLGIGNRLQGDAAVGLLVIEQAYRELSGLFSQVVFKQSSQTGFDIINDLHGFKKAIIVDNVMTGKKPPGFCHERFLSSLKETSGEKLIDASGISIGTMLCIGRKCGYKVPSSLLFLGVEVVDVSSFSSSLTIPIKNVVASVIGKIRMYLKQYYPLNYPLIFPNAQTACV